MEALRLLAEVLERLAATGTIQFSGAPLDVAAAVGAELESIGIDPHYWYARAVFALRTAQWGMALREGPEARRCVIEMARAIDGEMEVATPRQLADVFRHEEARLTGNAMRTLDEVLPVSERVRAEWRRLRKHPAPE